MDHQKLCVLGMKNCVRKGPKMNTKRALIFSNVWQVKWYKLMLAMLGPIEGDQKGICMEINGCKFSNALQFVNFILAETEYCSL